MAAKEFWQFAALGLLVSLLGLLFDQLLPVLLIYVLLWLGWYFYNLVRLERWLELGKKYSPPTSRG
ncbi:MAG TPA: DUF3329 domain-containing protein, partial [Gammaproteobacteria bacterium]|nr:DUF3329 domain-containing protein [Gammaproteobacteria bacterium]